MQYKYLISISGLMIPATPPLVFHHPISADFFRIHEKIMFLFGIHFKTQENSFDLKALSLSKYHYNDKQIGCKSTCTFLPHKVRDCNRIFFLKILVGSWNIPYIGVSFTQKKISKGGNESQPQALKFFESYMYLAR